MNYYYELQIKPTTDLNIITKAYETCSSSAESQNTTGTRTRLLDIFKYSAYEKCSSIESHNTTGTDARLLDAFNYLKKDANRFSYYAMIQNIEIDLDQLKGLVEDNNLIEIEVIVETLKMKHGKYWCESKQFYVECAIRDAILLGHTHLVEYFLKAGISAKIKIFEQGMTFKKRFRSSYLLAYYAAFSGNLKILQLLILHGANGFNTNIQEQSGTAMHAAITKGHTNIVEYLLQLGANANGYCNVGISTKVFIQIAAENNFPSVLTALITHGGDVELAIKSAQIYYEKILYRYPNLLDECNRDVTSTSDKQNLVTTEAKSKLYEYVNAHCGCLKILFDYAAGVDFESLNFLKNADVSGYNFVGVSIQGALVTKDILHEIGAVNVQQALFSLQDYSNTTHYLALQTRVTAKIQRLGGSIDQNGLVNLIPLYSAAENGDLTTVKNRLAAGDNPNQVDKNNISALAAAAINGYSDIVTCLLDAPNHNNALIFDAIRVVTQTVSSPEMKEWLYSILPINFCDQRGNTFLHLAAELGDKQQVIILLERGAVIDAKNYDRKTALYSVTSQSQISAAHAEVLEILLKNKTEAMDSDINNAFLFAWNNDRLVIIERLLPFINKSDVIDADSEIMVPWYVPLMFDALEKQDVVALFVVLKQHGADFNLQNPYGKSLLHEAIAKLPAAHSSLYDALAGDIKERVNPDKPFFRPAFSSIYCLLENDIDINHINSEGKTALQDLLQNKTLAGMDEPNQEILDFFISKNANLNVVTRHQYRLLHIAAESGNHIAIEILMRRGADIHAQTLTRQTPLHLAATNGHAKVCEQLLRAGADPYQEDQMRCRPFDCSIIGQKWWFEREGFTHRKKDIKGLYDFICRYRDTRQTITQLGYRDIRDIKTPSSIDELIRQRKIIFAPVQHSEKSAPVMIESYDIF